ncbi:dienelactone hydrolase family protein [Burkholderia sp. L27(2015)]|uniref:dienelactone hydrolase family protein n=1 Tax=Burkholderia sp. L27(2015) TaxID=1641858 RepID=UPI00131E5C2B|nr:dienelactone hydrolase family protein [Burkholderia sp. L27(2015)]
MSNTLKIDTPDGSYSAYIARPKTLPAPVVIVLQEIFGVNADMRESADEMAAQGFIAICPDLFWRQSANIELSDKTDWDQALQRYQKYDQDQGVGDIVAAIQVAATIPGSNGRVGLMGFCLGGLMTYLTCARSEVDAGVVYYGGSTEQHLSEVDGVHAPMIMHFGEEDEFISKDAQAAIKTAVKDHPGIEVYSYPGCSHAFARHRGEKYDAAAAKLANGRTYSFLKKQLA